MISVAIDPRLFALPEANCPDDEISVMVDRMSSWHELISDINFCLCISKGTSEALWEDGRFPAFSSLTRVLADRTFDGADAYTIAQVVTSLINTADSAESMFGIFDILTGDGFRCDIEHTESMPACEGEATKLAAIIGLYQHVHPCAQPRLAGLNTRGVRQLSVTGRLDVGELDTTSIHFPVWLNEKVTSCKDPNALRQSLDVISVWCSAKEEREFEFAIRVAAEQYPATSSGRLVNTQFGPRFISSFKKLHFDQDTSKAQRLLTACAEAILGEKRSQVHAIRTSKGGGADQVVNGSSKAWRRDIDYEYHLHYWQLPNGEVRFASVVPHSDCTIQW